MAWQFSDQDCDINVFLKSEQLISPELKAQVDQALELVAAGVAAISVKSQASPVQVVQPKCVLTCL